MDYFIKEDNLCREYSSSEKAFRNDWTLLLPGRSSNLKSIGSWSFAFLVFAGKFPELSAKANMSVPTFIRIFKQQMGDTPINLINKLRIDRAKEIIKNHSEELKVNEIAKMIGFSDPFYFSRV
jgi:AraC-like DNA-binding protein